MRERRCRICDAPVPGPVDLCRECRSEVHHAAMNILKAEVAKAREFDRRVREIAPFATSTKRQVMKFNPVTKTDFAMRLLRSFEAKERR